MEQQEKSGMNRMLCQKEKYIIIDLPDLSGRSVVIQERPGDMPACSSGGMHKNGKISWEVGDGGASGTENADKI